MAVKTKRPLNQLGLEIHELGVMEDMFTIQCVLKKIRKLPKVICDTS